MIKKKRKPCRHCGRPSYIFGDGLCTYCYNRRAYHAAIKQAKKAKKSINKVSKKLKNFQNKYRQVKAEHLKEHPCCEVRLPGCTGCDDRLLTIHHKKGRIGELLTDREFFLTACISCHSVIEKNPDLAYKNGWSLSRLEETDP